MDIDVRVCGIPAIARVLHYRPYEPAYRRGHPDNWEPASPPEIDFEILDRRGRPARWLERKLTERERERIERELIDYLETEPEYL
jgi:hypothetical protein